MLHHRHRVFWILIINTIWHFKPEVACLEYWSVIHFGRILALVISGCNWASWLSILGYHFLQQVAFSDDSTAVSVKSGDFFLCKFVDRWWYDFLFLAGDSLGSLPKSGLSWMTANPWRGAKLRFDVILSPTGYGWVRHSFIWKKKSLTLYNRTPSLDGPQWEWQNCSKNNDNCKTYWLDCL